MLSLIFLIRASYDERWAHKEFDPGVMVGVLSVDITILFWINFLFG